MPYLGQRPRDAKGKLGPYKWLSYAEVRLHTLLWNHNVNAADQAGRDTCGVAQAGLLRTHIGSGLLQSGVSPGSAVGLYSVNCSGNWPLGMP